MGLAASQARLLTITARLADNELRSQTINNAKMRLATQSSQASEDYVNALNNARLMFTNTDMNGLSQTQVLNFNNLMAYSPYNTQYGLVNSAGLALVSETEAKLYKEANGNLNTYLQAHGLEWETTFFDEKYDEKGNELNNIQAKLQSFYGTESTTDSSGKTTHDLGYLFDDLDYSTENGKQATNADFKALYEMYNTNQLSIERTNYKNLAQELYNELKLLYAKTAPMFREDVLGKDKNENDIVDSILSITGGSTEAIRHELRYCDMGSDLQMGLKDANRFLTKEGQLKVATLLESLNGYPSGNPNGVTTTTTTVTTKITTTTEPTTETLQLQQTANNPTWNVYGDYLYFFDGVQIGTPTGGHDYYTINGTGGIPNQHYYHNYQTSDGKWSKVELDGGAPVMPVNLEMEDPPYADLEYCINSVTVENDQGEVITRYQYNPDTGTVTKYNVVGEVIEEEVVTEQQVEVQEQEEVLSDEDLKNMIQEYFHALLDTKGYFEPITYALYHKGEGITGLEKFEEIYDKFTTIYGIDVGSDAPLLIDFQALMESEIEDIFGNTGKAGLLGTEEFHNVVDAYKIDLMVDVLGEPKYTWIDETDKTNTGNAEAKAQWYTNLFKRMEQGYRILEDGLASSSKWLEYAFESGLVGLEQVDKTYNWNALSYNTCSSISEESDSSEAVAVAEAKYRRAMNDIEQKDKMYDLQLKNIDTEHNSLQTEYDSIKTVISKNIERTMKFDQSA